MACERDSAVRTPDERGSSRRALMVSRAAGYPSVAASPQRSPMPLHRSRRLGSVLAPFALQSAHRWRRDTAVALADGGRLVVSGVPADHGEREVPGVADIDDRQ
jgi:hypothetical protein